jgi:WD40 repeat protein
LPDAEFVGLGFRDGGATIRVTSTDSANSTLATTDMDLSTGRARPSRTLGCPMPRSCWTVSDDGRYLAFAPMAGAAAGPTNVTVWDLDEDREAIKLPPIPDRMIAYAIEFSPDGGTLALGFEDGSIQLWDLAARRLRSTLPRPRENYSPLILNFSPDGSTLASFNYFSNRVVSLDLARTLIAAHLGDEDHTMQVEMVLFDVATGRPRISTPWEGLAVFSPDGRSVATTHDDSRVRIHDLPDRPSRSGGR